MCVFDIIYLFLTNGADICRNPSDRCRTRLDGANRLWYTDEKQVLCRMQKNTPKGHQLPLFRPAHTLHREVLMDSFKPISAQSYFTRKKVLVSYVMAVFVFWIHVSSFANYEGAPEWFRQVCWLFEHIIPPVAVPLFLILSGALFFRNYTPDAWGGKLKSRVRTLLIPYFCWNILMLLFQIVTTVFLAKYFIMRIPFDFTLKSFLEGLFHWKYNNPFWYIFALMVFALAAPLLDLLLRNKAVAFGSVVALWLLCQFDLGLPQPLFYDRSCIVYYLIGGILGRYYWPEFTADRGDRYFLPCLGGIAVCLGYLYCQVRGVIGKIPLFEIAVLTVYAFCLWICFDAICRRVTVRKYMEHSFWVYAMHMNVSAVFTKLIYLALPDHWGFAMPNFLLTNLLTLASIEVCCQILKKWFPPVYRTLGGARESV